MKRPISHRLSVLLAGFVLTTGPTHLMAQTAPEATPAPAPTATPGADMGSMPKWSEFPNPPAHIPTVDELHADVTETQAGQQQLKSEADSLVWDDTIPDAYAEAARNRFDPKFMAPIEAQSSPQQIEDMAADLRRRAAPPPVVN